VRLSKADLELIQRVRSGQFADKDLDPFDFHIEFEHKEMIHPFSVDEPKRRFLPSKWERIKVNKIVKAIRKGWMKTLAEQEKDREERQKEKIWDIWEDDSVVTWRPRKMPKAIAAPKRDLPIHAESYNPPEEYLLDENEKEEFEKKDPEDRPYNFLPQKFEALRKVPMYQDLIREHFERCLDLYLCPRVLKKKVNIDDPTKLIPELPQPSDLKPFPTAVSIEYNFHTCCVRSISVSPCGQYLASGDEDGNLIVWHVQTTRILRKYKLENKIVDCVEWNPSKDRCILTATNEEIVYVIQPGLYAREVNQSTSDMLDQAEKNYS
jgi:ribosome biogenesis protein ERB1